jgi:hypothetical protein
MRKFLSFMFVLGGFLAFSSCEKVSFEPVVIDTTAKISFKQTVKPPLQSVCSKCHSEFKSADLYNTITSNGFIDTVNLSSSKIYIKLTTDQAHIGRLAPALHDSVILWINQGAKNN